MFLLRNSRKSAEMFFTTELTEGYGRKRNRSAHPPRPCGTRGRLDDFSPTRALEFQVTLTALGREIPIGHTSDEGACAKATVFHIRTCESHIHKLLPHGKCDSNPSFPIGISSSPNNKNSQHGFCSIHVIPIDIPMRNAGAGYLRRHNRQSTWIGAKVGLHIPFQITVE